MGLDISKITNLLSDLCSEVKCKIDCCHEGILLEFDNKDSPAHNIHASASDASI